jgi:hypothetical protein
MSRPPRYDLGAVVMSKNPSTSILEENVRQKLRDAGLKLHKGRSAIQCGHEPERDNHPVLSPDILVSSAKVAVEVDSEMTHAGSEENDLLRNRLLEGVGWTVVRLRLGGLRPLGAHDVTAEASTPTIAAIAALVEAVEDAVAGRPGTVRHVAKAVRPKSTKVPSKLGAISPHKYTENAFYASWSATGSVERMVLMDGGNYLAASLGYGAPEFICWTGLAGTPRAAWRPRLTEIIEQLDDYIPVSKFPWGDDLFIGEQAANVRVFEKFNAGGEDWDATANLIGVDSITDTSFLAAGQTIAQLHDGAVDAGWRIADLRILTGMYGAYQRFTLIRNGVRSGLWATT